MNSALVPELPVRVVRSIVALALGTTGGALPAQGRSAPPPLAIVNARIWTGDSARPRATAIALRDGRIVAVGDGATARRAAGTGARVIDGRGATVVPGFTDAHVHFLDGGFRLSGVQLRDVRTRAQFVARIAAFVRTVPPGTWVVGGDWDHEAWGGALPTRDWIDAVSPAHPVFVSRLDGHMALANSRAIALAGGEAALRDVSGGVVVRDGRGRPTGVLKDNAMDAVWSIVPAPPPALVDRALDSAMAYVAAQGVTSVHHVGSWLDFAALRRARAQERLRVRVRAAVPLDTWARLRDTVAAAGAGDDWLAWGMLKGFVDGSLGSHTAAMLAPFTDAPRDTGVLVTPPDSLRAWIAGADRAGLQVAVHAIGDRANRLLLDIYAEVARVNGPRDRRWRIEHAQHLDAADVPRFRALGVIASMQPYHAIDDGRWAERVIGRARAAGAYAIGALHRAGATVAFGSDWFVAPSEPLRALDAAVSRRTLDGAHPRGWVPAERIALDDALRAHTAAGAYAGFAEGRRGVLRVGLDADLVLLDRDVLADPARALPPARVRLTVVGGRIVHERR
jgi:predicted amidohydrolase YtcJ